MSSYHKVKDVGKEITTKGDVLDDKILRTMRTISSLVGATLGPGGQPVLLERQEHSLPAFITKDGVTVFRSLGFEDPTAHCIMEAARDAAVRTVAEAGDGTTTATILAEAIVRYTHAYCRSNPHISPQKIVSKLQDTFRDHIEPEILQLARKVELGTEDGDKLLASVAAISANTDVELAEAVMECFHLTGDDGSVTIVESTGPRKCEVEAIDGYPIPSGYEDSCGPYYAKFVNDPGNQRVYLQQPVFVLYHGRISEVQTIAFLMETVATMWQAANFPHNVVLIATGFSEQVLSTLALNFVEGSTINVFPLIAPQSPYPNAQYEFLRDISAITGATIFDPMNLPMDSFPWGEAVQEGYAVDLLHEHLGPGLDYFEAYRYRSNLVGQADDDLILVRADELQTQLNNPVSELDKLLLQERYGKLTGGIAKLKVMGSSNGELKERRDRAEDAICAVRGAIKRGCLPGGGWTLLYLAAKLHQLNDDILEGVLIPALSEPVFRLLSNCGVCTAKETQQILGPVLENVKAFIDGETDEIVTYEAINGAHVSAYEAGILDSTPAVQEAIQNSISIAALLGTLGGTVVFARDHDLERGEARATHDFLRNANHNPANERP